ncbi:MAG: NAD(+)/NADH kinase [bacterium]|nr:NAD(+)/NADH kinase [bacterium]
MRFGLIANLSRIGARKAIDTVLTWAQQQKHELVLCSDLQQAVPGDWRFVPQNELANQVDMIVSMGGDGTLLGTGRSVGASGTPILGVNLGSLGFLTTRTPEQIVPSLEAVVAGEYTIAERMLLKALVYGKEVTELSTALNDIVLDNGPSSRVLDINLRVNGEDVVTYKADGLVISTATGSTAYSLAVGGPIMHPKMEAMIAAPIAAFSLTTRPMIFSGDDILELRVLSRGRVANLTLDGQIVVGVREGEPVTIKKADFKLRFVSFPESSYYKLLKNKLHWGVPPDYHSEKG